MLPLFSSAQKKKTDDKLKAARTEYESLRFVSAIRLLQPELKNHPDNVQAQELIANSYRLIKDYDDALLWYARLTKNTPLKPEWALYYAEALANNRQYPQADEWYQTYMKMAEKDSRGKNLTKFYVDIDNFLKNKNEWDISFLNINTPASEYSPVYYQKGLLFASNRKVGGAFKTVFGWDETPFSDLYYVKDLHDIKSLDVEKLRNISSRYATGKKHKAYRINDDDTAPTSNDSRTVGNYNPRFFIDTFGFNKSERLEPKLLEGEINTKYHEGSAAILPNGSIIFTRNNYYKAAYHKSRDGINKLKMFTAIAPEYKDIQPFPYNNDEYSVGHPALNNGGTVMIFASDMPGGYGGTDLYYTKRPSVNMAWEKPVNMGPIVNTPGDELFPTLYDNKTLYFSSNGLPGLGGLDIFKVAVDDWTPLQTPVNLGTPINSSVDDFGLIRSPDGTKGYFTSNREGSDDIYSVNHLDIQIKLHGTVLDSVTNEVVCYNYINVSPTATQAPNSDMLCDFDYLINSDVNYQISVTNDGYSTVRKIISTKGIYHDTTINVVLKIRQLDPLYTQHNPNFNCDAVKRQFTINRIYWDLDKSVVRDDAKPEMSKIIKLMKAHPDLKLVLASYCDSRESKAYNMALSSRRSASAKEYLVNQGIDASRLFTEHFGENNLITNCPDGVNCSEAEHQVNRRTEFFLIKGGKKIVNMNCATLEQLLSNY
ncbi:OmpA family protein [Mucilaginibacter sp. KACC 22063]|uniref:OmpA family protein n=1 Tax=Mucilaginibacter sp. KACC 22063 TaxID=3025666 RepID=UPI0023661682|nr:OmpA family protein [Mucilaginibacter sp. KACC 22063]WDF53338.1 OmpA family protein [Mucilaginibacter sp. KACC 22063]